MTLFSVNNPSFLFVQKPSKLQKMFHQFCTIFLLLITFVSTNYGLLTKHQLNTVVRYLGEDYYLKDGCPLPDCDDRERGCFKRQIELKKKFNGRYR